MDKPDIILRCLCENWPAEVSMVGEDLVEQIVADALQGQEVDIRTAPGGFNFDLVPYIDTIIAGAALLVYLVETYINYRRNMPPPPYRTEKDVVEMLAQILVGEKNMEYDEAVKLARLVMSVISVISNRR